MNFSDPILVSSDSRADQVRIKINKSFFMSPKAGSGRQLAKMTEDEQYLIITEDIPKQVGSLKEL